MNPVRTRSAHRAASAVLAAMLVQSVLPAGAQVHLPPPPPVVHMPNLIWHQFMMNQIGTNAIGSSVLLDSIVKDMQGLAQTASATSGVEAAFADGRTLADAADRPGAPASDTGVLSFTPSGHSLLAERIARADPTQDAASLDALFSGAYRDYLTAFREEHERLGMPQHDVAAAFTSYVVMSYMDAHELDAIDAETSLAVYRQSAARFVANAKLAAMAAQERELLAETFVVLGATPRLVFAETGDPARRRQAGIDNLVRVFGPVAGSLRLSPAGIGHRAGNASLAAAGRHGGLAAYATRPGRRCARR